MIRYILIESFLFFMVQLILLPNIKLSYHRALKSSQIQENAKGGNGCRIRVDLEVLKDIIILGFIWF